MPREYLADYYSAVEPDERQTIAFFVDAMKEAEPDEPVLFFGVGPTLHHVFLAADKASEIHLGDYLPANLEEIERWIGREPDAHDGDHSSATRSNAKAWPPRPMENRATRGPHARQDHKLLQVDTRHADPCGSRTTGRTDGGQRLLRRLGDR